MKYLLPFIYALLAGVFTTLEATINAKLARMVTPKIATLHNLVTGVLVILVANIIAGSLNQYRSVLNVSPQWLIGGILGTFIVYFGVKAVPELGIANTLTLIVVAQLVSGLMADVYILKHQIIDIYKIFGVILLFLGTYLVVR